MLKNALFIAIAVYMPPAPSQSDCSMNSSSMKPAAHVGGSLQGKAGRVAANNFDPKINNGAYWAQQQVCKRQTA